LNKIIGFKNQKPIHKDVDIKPEKLLEITFPKSEVTDAESKARALLGVKHGSTNQILGIPNKKIAQEMGFGDYNKLRIESANEDEQYPELIIAEDDEAFQESTEAEPKKSQKPGKKTLKKPAPTPVKGESEKIEIHLHMDEKKPARKFKFNKDAQGLTQSVEEIEEVKE
jgi:hypothetical protein